jgi:2-dehydro-3-deoxy-D-arabinonate dehydratase
MHIVRFAEEAARPRVGVLDERGIAPIERVAGLGELLTLPRADIQHLVTEAATRPERVVRQGVSLLAPADGRTEVWAAGVTYERSRAARVEESKQQSVYELVYEADRPELFFKAPAWRVVTDGQPAALRADAANSVPEPELAIVVNAGGELIGATVCDDLTARAIEGENPLYLPQAKIYTGSCALAARIRPWWEIPDPLALTIRMRVLRDGAEVFTGETSTARLHRGFEDLVSWLFREIDLPEGAVLATGTGIVPPLDEGIEIGDVVEIEIDEIGTLRHELVAAKDLRW